MQLFNQSIASQSNRRNPLFQPFASDSIWNHPIGDEAWYVPTNLKPAYLSVDTDHFFVTTASDPNRNVFRVGGWRNRATGTVDSGIDVPLPNALIIPDTNEVETPNNSAAFLLPDGNTLLQLNATTRDRLGGNLYGVKYPFGPHQNETLDGDGALGGHGGSGLSSIGGTLRIGELTGDDPIQHALKINLWAKNYFSYAQGAEGGRGYTWPAVKADDYANSTTYGGNQSDLLLGSLLAIPTSITPDNLGLETEPARKMFYALQNYGAYVVDDTAWDSHAIAVESGVLQEFEYAYGYSFKGDSGPFYEDMMALFDVLHVVKNNRPNRIGGGGDPLVPFAPDIDQRYVSELQALQTDPTINDTFYADFNGDGKEDVMFRNLATGANQVFLRDDQGRIIGGGNILPVASWDWQIEGASDVDRDGRAELRWSNLATGERALWHLDDLRLWHDPNTGQRVSRWLDSAAGAPRIESLTPVSSVAPARDLIDPSGDSGTPSGSRDLINNGGFERNLTDWDVFRGAKATTYNAFVGTKSLKLNGDDSGVSQIAAISAGESYQLTAYAQTSGTDRSTIGIDAWDENWNQLDSTSIRITTSAWSNYELDYTPTARAAWVTVWAWQGGDGVTYIDEVSLQSLVGD